MEEKDASSTLNFHLSFFQQSGPKHQSKEEEELRLSGPHHTVGSFHTSSRAGGISVSSAIMLFLL